MNESSFQNLCSKLNTSFQTSTPEEVKQSIQTIEKAKNEIKKKIKKDDEITLEDKEYLQTELKMIIDTSHSVFQTLSEEIKIGSQPRMYEVYGGLLQSMVVALRELRDLNKIVADMKIMNEIPEETPQQQKTINLTGNQLLDLIDSAKKNSSLNEISTHFEVIADENSSLELKKKEKEKDITIQKLIQKNKI